MFNSISSCGTLRFAPWRFKLSLAVVRVKEHFFLWHIKSCSLELDVEPSRGPCLVAFLLVAH